jgi:dynein heavy chain
MDGQDELRKEGVQYMLHQVFYGGKATDDMDRRFIGAQVEEIFVGELSDIAFSLDGGGGKYCMPGDTFSELGTLDAMNSFVHESWPQEDEAAAYGLSAHANTVVDHRTAVDLLSPLKAQLASSSTSISEQLGSTGKGAPLQVIVDELSARMPTELDADRAKRNHAPAYDSPMNYVLLHEVGRYNKLLHVVSRSTQDLSKAVKASLPHSTAASAQSIVP